MPDSSNLKDKLTERMLLYLYEASPWLRFTGVVFYIIFGFFVLGGIAAIIIPFALSGFTYIFDESPLWLYGVLYMLGGFVYFFPARFLYNFGAKIRSYRFTNSSKDLEQAFKNNKSLWKFYGILCIIFIAFIPVSIVLAIIGGLFAAFGGLFL